MKFSFNQEIYIISAFENPILYSIWETQIFCHNLQDSHALGSNSTKTPIAKAKRTTKYPPQELLTPIKKIVHSVNSQIKKKLLTLIF